MTYALFVFIRFIKGPNIDSYHFHSRNFVFVKMILLQILFLVERDVSASKFPPLFVTDYSLPWIT